MSACTIAIIFSPYYVGLGDHRVGNGPNGIRSLGLVKKLERLGAKIELKEINRVDDFEGEIGRSFEIMRRTSLAVTEPSPRIPFIYYDAHNDLDPPDVHENGYVNPWICPYSKVKVGRLDFVRELITQLERRSYSPALVHIDLDVLEESRGKVNNYPSFGGLFESELIVCMNLIPKRYTPKSLTVSSFDPDAGDGDKIAQIAIRAINTFVQSL
ncbi:hypothetical protein SPOG_01631 [Schizosaccharomyces cryophilus OY26]|uniref:Arginase n=1 Tax=Schizosaccharomyces cryophilus (strain OY26 / ATCC MYA-4695 / CBS 11777 / NBRC 106824 / NRRL Y48691) TaxID=653667 RepID=S9W2M2_SCHCR|nr:uncharacterized protein SPOG_01631 [Schizosaccharomyces cryophilus OY26]EPY52300.1 hypothetical protein SPOG_01631 [Schizosaccharomyces cryophilus OY26]